MARHHRPPTPARPIDRLLSPIIWFQRVQAGAGLLLLGCTVAALLWANLDHAGYEHLWHAPLEVTLGRFELSLSLAHFVNDGLMAIFFFVVGLEIKREFLAGELASFRRAAVPIVAAAGGMAAPAIIASIIAAAGDDPVASRGWAIPMATDIAFAVGVMAILGKRVPFGLRVFVTALAIVDDLGAVVVIAIFYTSHIDTAALAASVGIIAVSALCSSMGVRSAIVYGLLGGALWVLLLESGVHATVGGVLLAMTIPVRVRIGGDDFVRFARETIERFESAGRGGDSPLANAERQSLVNGLEHACEHVQAPLNRLEHLLHPWVAFAIMPIFALANAGVVIGGGIGEAAVSSVGLGVALGLLAGKPIGIVIATWVAVKTGLGELPGGTTWRQLVGAGFLAGIGFTMSLFIGNLAFDADSPQLLAAKVGILGGSIVAGAIGFVLLRSVPAPATGTLAA